MITFSEDCKIVISSTVADGAAGQTVITGAPVDTAGYDGVCYIVPLGPITANAVTSLKVQQAADSGGSPDDFTDLAGTNQAIADDADNTVRYVDIRNPGKRYVKLVISRATQNATVGGVVAVLYRASWAPVTQGTNVSGERHNAPVEGTA